MYLLKFDNGNAPCVDGAAGELLKYTEKVANNCLRHLKKICLVKLRVPDH